MANPGGVRQYDSSIGWALAALIAAWPMPPDAIKAGIRALIQPWEDQE